ncbi:MAG TPA: TlpA disulfide reductase family protein [Gemmatimonadales bacterium]|nr:TlpA disulfide reductase family protein [Gemmatimonadales bacterium]
MRFAGLAILFAAFTTACGNGEMAARFAPLDVGSPVPVLAVRTLSGDSAHVGGDAPVTLLNVWATWCTPCEREFPELQRLHEAHAPQGLRILAVSIDTGNDQAVADFAAERGATFLIGRDPEGRVQDRFMTIGVPETFLITADGRLAWRKLGELPEHDPALAEKLAELLEPPTG